MLTKASHYLGGLHFEYFGWCHCAKIVLSARKGSVFNVSEAEELLSTNSVSFLPPEETMIQF